MSQSYPIRHKYTSNLFLNAHDTYFNACAGELSVQNAFPIAELMELYANEQSALTSFNGGMWANKNSSDSEETV